MWRIGCVSARLRSRGSALLFTLALVVILAGCAAPSLPPLPWQQTRTTGPTPLPDAQQVLRVTAREVGESGDAFLDPMLLRDTRSDVAHILPLLYSGLFTLDARLRPVPALASGYTISADGLRYTFTLRSDARFADGASITSADVAFSLNLAMSPCEGYGTAVFSTVKDQPRFAQQSCGNGSPVLPTITPQHGQSLLATLVGDALLASDPHTLVVVLSRPDGALPAKLAEPYSGVVERSVVERYGVAWPQHLAEHGGQGTSGMYALSALTSVVNGGARLTLTRANAYWGAAPRLREVIVTLYSGVYEQTPPPGDVIFAAGASPAAYAIPREPPPVLSKLPGFHQAPARDEDYLLLDPTAPGQTDLRLRQALALALNKPALAALVDGVATNHIIPPGTGDYLATPGGPIAAAPLTGDVARARALWQSYIHDLCGGVASRCPAVRLWVFFEDLAGPDPFQQTFTQMVARQWQSALPGIRPTFSYVGAGLITSTTFVGHASYVNWDEEYPDPQDWLAEFAVMPGSALPPLVHDPQADGLVARAEATLDPTTRLALYQQAESTLLTDAVVIPIAQERDAWTVKPTVANFPADPEPFIAPSAWARIYLTAPAGA